MLRSLLKNNAILKRNGFVMNEQFSSQKVLALNDLQNIEGSRPLKKRVGRGIGSGLGKNSGHGHQKSRSTPRAFEGGQTPLYKRLPKIGFHNYTEKDLQIVNLNKIQEFIDMGRLTPKENNMITMRDLLESGIVSRVKEGVKLLAKGKVDLKVPLHFEVSFASEGAIKAVEAAGGTVTCVHFNRLALRALIKPVKFEILPRRARPSPKIIDYYLDRTKSGYLSPEIQTRNLALFGFVTTEEQCREEFDKYAHMRMKYIQLDKRLTLEFAEKEYEALQANEEKKKAEKAEKLLLKGDAKV